MITQLGGKLKIWLQRVSFCVFIFQQNIQPWVGGWKYYKKNIWTTPIGLTYSDSSGKIISKKDSQQK